jgi:hypothetical protein
VALYPLASWRRLPGTEPAIQPRAVIFHTMVGYLTSTDAYFRSGRSGGIEAHFGVGGRWGSDLAAGLDGKVWQWRDTAEQADANLHANDFAISIETADNAPASAADLAPWTAAQLAALIALGRWLRETHRIPARVCQSPTDSGFGWHAMWGAPSAWTPSAGKVCPGAARIGQLHATVFPAIFAAGTPSQEDDLFEETDRTMLAAVHKQITGAVAAGQTSFAGTIVATLTAAQLLVNEGRTQSTHLDAAITACMAGDDENLAMVLAALTKVNVELTDAQVGQLADQLHLSPQAIAEAVRLDLAGHLAPKVGA